MTPLQKDMCVAARDLLGPGYVSDYYRNAAAEFIQIAEHYSDEAYKLGMKKGASKAKTIAVIPPPANAPMTEVYG